MHIAGKLSKFLFLPFFAHTQKGPAAAAEGTQCSVVGHYERSMPSERTVSVMTASSATQVAYGEPLKRPWRPMHWTRLAVGVPEYVPALAPGANTVSLVPPP
ncbi:hypothetical protein TW95_gp1288 [Pandoravirus inopinatum]|uniref:Uncharacterized protein n=1 Tax=Pandoravirus inopinatum TaxID=1605721 RepID=A0A0B5JE32_9VIRU|nr:hypothetical protein TW95_gp1288 [Pandoravirus inopinatum]AJF98022.1 hypothetical protein [Pandoravirus inopinatum]